MVVTRASKQQCISSVGPKGLGSKASESSSKSSSRMVSRKKEVLALAQLKTLKRMIHQLKVHLRLNEENKNFKGKQS